MSQSDPQVLEILRHLGYGDLGKPLCLGTYRKIQQFLRSYTCASGLPATAICSTAQLRDLSEIATAFLDLRDNGESFWPVKAESPQLLQYETHRRK